MKVLFIFKNENFIAPLGPMIVSAAARQDKHETYLCEMNSEDPLARIAGLKPDVVAYSSSTGESKHYLRLNRRIKEKFPDILTIMGGPHATFNPDIIHETTLDAVCVGEGEGAFRDLLGALSSGKAPAGIPNIVTRQEKDFSMRRLVEDLDALPFPDYALFYDNTPMGQTPLKSFMASRGCPYSCTYCFNTAWRKIYSGHGNIVRRHSVDYVIEDIRRVKERWPLSCVKFYDDIFTYRADAWLEEFAKKYREQIGLPFFILTRYDLLNEDMVKLLKYAGCRTISMSIEAGNPQVRERILKRSMPNERIIASERLAHQYGIYTFTNCILGLPGTTLDQDIESLDLCLKAKVTWAEFPIFYPYPKTELGDQVINAGLYTPEYEKMHTSYQNASLLNCFTEQEKRAQMNLGILASVAVVLPWLRTPIVKWLIRWPPNRLFTLAYWVVKNYTLRSKIYVTKTGFWQSLGIYLKSLRQELFRHSVEEKVSDDEGPGA